MLNKMTQVHISIAIFVLVAFGLGIVVLIYLCIGYIYKKRCLRFTGFNALPNSEMLLNVGICCKYGNKSKVTMYKGTQDELEMLTHEINKYSAEPVNFSELRNSINPEQIKDDFEISFV